MTQAQFGELVGMSQQAVSDFYKNSALGPGVPAGDTLIAYCERLREVAAGRASADLGGLDLVQERAALAREQRLGYEIKNAVARGEYGPIALLSEVLAMASQAVVERFEQLPAMLKKACPEMSDSARDQVMAAIVSARNEWVAHTSELVVRKVDEMDAEAEEVVDA
jgi:phage terminase Nu1 subunit (DNA packaging protein)